MSLQSLLWLSCDATRRHCRVRGPAGKDLREARELAKAAGWDVGPRPSPITSDPKRIAHTDYCPACKALRPAPITIRKEAP